MPDETRALTEVERVVLSRIAARDWCTLQPRMWISTSDYLRGRGLIRYSLSPRYEHDITAAGRRALARATGDANG